MHQNNKANLVRACFSPVNGDVLMPVLSTSRSVRPSGGMDRCDYTVLQYLLLVKMGKHFCVIWCRFKVVRTRLRLNKSRYVDVAGELL